MHYPFIYVSCFQLSLKCVLSVQGPDKICVSVSDPLLYS